MSFDDLNLEQKIINAIRQLGYIQPTKVQEKSIPKILTGGDYIVRSETGSGKTFAFVLPILNKIDSTSDNLQALVVCPTRELAMQVADETKRLAEQLDVKVSAVFGGSNIDRQIKSLKKQPQIVVGTTGRILDLINKKALKIENCNFVVLDEADEMLDMGFKPDIEKIFSHTKKNKQTLLFSATIPSEVKDIAKNFQNNAEILEIGTANKALENIKQYYIFTNKNTKKQALLQLFFSDLYKKTIIFVNTKAFVQELEHLFVKNKIQAKAIHGDLKQTERKRILDGFRNEKFYILIATDVASRGLDIKGVEYVVNYDLPHELEFYVHRIGRTARAGKSGSVINIITTLEQLSYMRDIEKLTKAKIEKYQTNSENLKQFIVDTKQLAKQKTKSKYINNNLFDVNNFEDEVIFDSGKNQFKPTKNKTKNLKSKKNTKSFDYLLKNNKLNNNVKKSRNKKISFEESFARGDRFKRFSTFDNFDEFYANDYKIQKKSKNIKIKKNNKSNTTKNSLNKTNFQSSKISNTSKSRPKKKK